MSPTDGGNPCRERGRDLARLAAGLADFGLEQAEGLLRRAREAARRNDYADLAADAHTDLLARGEVLLARLLPVGEAHMEALARLAKQNRDTGRAGGAGDAGGIGGWSSRAGYWDDTGAGVRAGDWDDAGAGARVSDTGGPGPGDGAA